MAASGTAELFAKGVEALGNGHFYLARTCFERAVEEERTPRHCSYLAISLAKTLGACRESVSLGREAISREPENPIHYLHLSRIYLMASKRQEALEVLREGLKYGRDPALIRELEALGTRKPVVFKRLSRQHFLNKFAGILLARLGLR